MTCPACNLASTTPHTGAYDFHCLGCCVRLVANSRPNRKRQEAMLAVIAKFPGAPSRKEILDSLTATSQRGMADTKGE